MTDVHDKKTRSFNMSRIRSKNTKPEMFVRKLIFSRGFRYKLHDKRLPGKPDMVLPKYKTVILVHGCFWHQHSGCKNCGRPGSNKEYWEQKLASNREKDRRNEQLLKSMGWQVVVVWECELRNEEKLMIRLEENLYHNAPNRR